MSETYYDGVKRLVVTVKEPITQALNIRTKILEAQQKTHEEKQQGAIRKFFGESLVKEFVGGKEQHYVHTLQSYLDACTRLEYLLEIYSNFQSLLPIEECRQSVEMLITLQANDLLKILTK